MQVFYICKFDSLPCISIFIVLVTYWLPMLQWLSYAQHIATTRSKGHWFWLFTFLYFTSYRTALNFHGSLISRTFYRLQNYFNENFDIWTTVFLLRIARTSIHNILELCCQIRKGHLPKRYLQHCFADSCELELNCACTAFHGKLIIMYLLWHLITQVGPLLHQSLLHNTYLALYITVRTELSFWPSICRVCCRQVNQFNAWTQFAWTQRWYDNVEESWLRMRKRLSCSFPPHSNELCSLIWIWNNKLSVIMTNPFLQ